MTRPKFISGNNSTPILNLIKSRHPCMSNLTRNFIPNDIVIGQDQRNCIVITGPNMGGKSTLLRQTSICVIMAQIGSYVPAELCELTPVDRIFTRIGARDK
jgi:DNA mismatch repair protein MSH6